MNPVALFLNLLSRTTARELGYYEQFLPTFTFSRTIPKVIHQIFISPKNSDTDIPKRVTEHIEIIKRLNPDYVYKLWKNNDVEEFIATNYGQCMLDYYMRIDDSYGAIKADLFRYLLIYKEGGGVYFDLKIQFDKSFSEVIRPEDTYLLSHWDNGPGEEHEGWGCLFEELRHIDRGEYIMGVIISSPGHPYLREVIKQTCINIDNYNPHQDDVGYGGTIKLSGPVMYSLVIEKMLPQRLHRLIEIVPKLKMRYLHDQTSSLLKSDYRKNYKPIIHNKGAIVNKLNDLYFWLLSFYRNQIKRGYRRSMPA